MLDTVGLCRMAYYSKTKFKEKKLQALRFDILKIIL